MKNILLLLVFAIFSSLSNAQNIPSYVPANGLVGWWPFNGSANDESGNGINGTVYGATLTTDRNGNSNAAYDFDGSNDYILVPGNNIPVWGKTYSIWVEADNLGFPPYAILEHGSVNSSKWSFRIGSNRVESDLGVGCSGGGSFASFPNSMNTNGWKHLVLRDNGSDTLEIFLNDTLVLTQITGYPPGINCSASGLYVGVDIFSFPEYFDGTLDDIGVWNRRLSDSEIHNLYLSNNCQDSLTIQPISSSFQTVPGGAYFTTGHTDTAATFQWQQNAGTGWTNLSDFGIYSGTTSDSLVLTGITSSMNGYGYRCIIDACSMDTTDIAFLTVVNNIGQEEIIESIIVSPNPTSGSLSINLTSTCDYTLYNVSGQVVSQGKTDGNLDITPLPAGSYQLVLTSEGRTSKHSVQKL